jgi:hypothetical protein
MDVAVSGLPEEQLMKAIQQAITRGLVSKDALISVSSQRGSRVRQLLKRIPDMN